VAFRDDGGMESTPSRCAIVMTVATATAVMAIVATVVVTVADEAVTAAVPTTAATVAAAVVATAPVATAVLVTAAAPPALMLALTAMDLRAAILEKTMFTKYADTINSLRSGVERYSLSCMQQLLNLLHCLHLCRCLCHGLPARMC